MVYAKGKEGKLTGIIPQRPVYQKGQKPQKVPVVRNAARNEHCTLHIYGVCRNDPAYTVGCHLRMFGLGGTAQKPDDLFIVDACDKCHAVLDDRTRWADAPLGWDDVLCALMRTQHLRRAAGLIHIGKLEVKP